MTHDKRPAVWGAHSTPAEALEAARKDAAERIDALTAEVVALRNRLDTAGIELARRDDRVRELEQQLAEFKQGYEKWNGLYNVIRIQRDEARAVARSMTEESDILDWDGEWEYSACVFCGEHIHYRDWKAKTEPFQNKVIRDNPHAPDCPVSKVRAWDAPKPA